MPVCTECEAPVQVPDDAALGEVLACRECSAELEVVGVAPLALALAPEVGEDWGE